MFERGVFCGATVYGSEAERLFRLYESYGVEYACVDVTKDGRICGLIRLAGVSAQFNVVFESARQALGYARRVTHPTPQEVPDA